MSSLEQAEMESCTISSVAIVVDASTWMMELHMPGLITEIGLMVFTTVQPSSLAYWWSVFKEMLDGSDM